MDEASAGASRRRGHWTPGEDEKLRQLVEQYGPQNWNSIAAKLQGRSEEEEDNVRLFGKRRSHNFISSSPGDITMSNFLTKPSTYEEAADTINSGLCKEIAAGLQKFRVMNSHSEEPEESCTMHKNVGFIDFLGVGT
ncbi:uncharacterized protein LOC116245996 isoform X2 [Nymphaea colorata]|uniref:uncharacterized protein LOC116245996 isoform X2 n=1 Tax=Nymphaea colorata TaxID=210225 RepID=UPI00129E960D|nr:uncharacterized protein LOC116245996 isoform X2 [Nymphaea colorata]